MRARLLIETTIPDDEITNVAEMIAEQPPVEVIIRSRNGLGVMTFRGYFIGAQQSYGPGGQ